MRTITLSEERTTRFPQGAFTEAEASTLLRSKRFDFDPANAFNGFTHGLRPRGWVGQIPIGSDLLVAVAPKVPVRNIFRMLEVAYNLKSFKLFDGAAAVEILDDVYERIVEILCRRVLDRARRGLFRHYVESSDELPYVRGAIAPVTLAIRRERGQTTIPCRFEEQTADITDNQIIYFTLRRIARAALRRPEVQANLDRARRALSGTVSHQEFAAKDCIHRLYHRLNHDYRPMHGLCRFILEQTGPSFATGEHAFVPFELYMPQLFESYVAQWLSDHLPGNYASSAKYTARIDANFAMTVEIDVLVREQSSNHPTLVLDTKYKEHATPSEADIYQIAFYAREMGVQRAALIYPMKLDKPARIRANGVTIDCVSFDLSQDLDVAGKQLLREIF